MHKVLLVSEELAGVSGSGGIGAAFEELALCLANNSFQVDFMIVPVQEMTVSARDALEQRFAQNGIRLVVLDREKYVWSMDNYENRSYAISRHLIDGRKKYDFIHFHDYKGLAYFSLAAKRQGLAFHHTVLIVQAHGPTRWTIDANKTLFTHPDQLRIDFMERRSMEWADHLISPSRYLIDWMQNAEFKLPYGDQIHVIKNICTLASRFAASVGRSEVLPGPVNEIIYFARHEDRKGFAAFCDAIDEIEGDLASRGIQVTFLGKLGEINGRPSGVELTNRAKRWHMPICIRTQLDRYGALRYLVDNPRSVVVIPSPTENSPYTVVEASVIGKPVITSVDGGAKELITRSLHEHLLAEITREGLAARIREAVTRGLPAAAPAETPQQIEAQWVAFHHQAHIKPQNQSKSLSAAIPVGDPRVVFGITHYERTQKLTEAIVTALRQDYNNIEIVVVDDGSKSEAAVAGLRDIERILNRVGGRIIRQQNRYLGAARNTIARETSSDYLIFLDDDDLAYRNLTSTLVHAAHRTQADITGCFNVFLEENLRAGVAPAPESFQGKVSYAPLGGPLSVAPFENWLGAATALIKRSHFDRLDGYTEVHGVGFEDYEFFFRSLQMGAKIEIVPEPLYLYEVGRPSMVSKTSLFQNYRRVLGSLDLSGAKADWYDLIAMNTGRKVLEERTNKLHWEYRTSDHSKFLLPLLDTSVSPSQYVERLVAYAHAIDAHHLAQAWAVSTESRPIEETERPQVFHGWRGGVNKKIDPRKYGMAPLDLDIVADLSLGRIEDAVAAFVLRLEKNISIDRSGSDILSLIVQNVVRSRYLNVEELVIRILASRFEKEVESAIIPNVVVLAYICGKKELVHQIILDDLAQDGREYLSRFSDVGASANIDPARAGLDHYEKHGYYEKRAGFPRLTKIAEELGRYVNIEVKPWTLSTMFGVKMEVSEHS